MKRFVLCIWFAVSAVANVAAETLTGTVRESSSNDAIPYATVSLLFADSTLCTGAISDDNGNFHIQASADSYILKISYVGYQYAYRNIDLNKGAADVGNIFLSQETMVMSEVEIKADKPIIQRQMDKIVMNVSSSPFAVGSSGEDMLKKAPGVVIDKNGNVTVNGKGVEIFIDGRPTYMNGEQLKGLLQGTDATTVDKIEIITNPSAKYDAAGRGGIINIKLKKNKSAGINGTLSGSYGGMYFAEPDMYHQTERLSFTLNHRGAKTYTSLSLSQNYQTQGAEGGNAVQQPMAGDTMRYNANSLYNGSYQYYTARLTNDWYINDKNTFGFMVGVPVMVYDMYVESGKQNALTLLGKDTIQYFRSKTEDHDVSPRVMANLNYTYVLNDSLSRELTVNADYNRYSGNDVNQLTNNVFVNNDAYIARVPDQLRIRTHQVIDIASVKADFQTAFWKTGMIECGAKYTISHTANAMTEDSVMPGYTNTVATGTDYTEHIAAMYITAYKRFGEQWDVKLGLRGELTASEGLYKKANQTEEVKRKPYFNLFPSVVVGYSPTDKWSLGLNYARRIQRPGYWSLNPFVSYQDAHAYTVGNPDLKPSFSNELCLSVGWSRYVSLDLAFSHAKDVVTFKPEILANGDVRNTYLNFGTEMNIGGSLSLTEIPIVPKFKTDENGKRQLDGAWVALTAHVGLYDYIAKVAAEADPDYGTRHALQFFCRAAITAYLPKDWQIAVDGFGMPPVTEQYSCYQGGYTLNAAVRKSWPQHGLTLTAKVDDIARSLFFSESAIGMPDGYSSSSFYRVYGQQVSIGLSWRFGKQLNHKDRNVGDFDQSDRLGGGKSSPTGR